LPRQAFGLSAPIAPCAQAVNDPWADAFQRQASVVCTSGIGKCEGMGCAVVVVGLLLF
jgi:hypothetical protein